jgi:effector-binding domain-containing protein
MDIQLTTFKPQQYLAVKKKIATNGLGNVSDSELSLVDVAESKAAMGVLRGSYSGLKNAHGSLMNYMTEHKLTPSLTVEQYTVGSMEAKSADDFVTDVYYLYN